MSTRQEEQKRRNQHLIELLKAKRPLRSIHKIVGMPMDHCKDVCTQLIKEHNLDYDFADISRNSAEETPFGITTESQVFRHNLATLLYSERENKNAIALAMALGLSEKAQRKATIRPYNHDWSISELERFARFRGQNFTEFMGELLSCPTLSATSNSQPD